MAASESVDDVLARIVGRDPFSQLLVDAAQAGNNSRCVDIVAGVLARREVQHQLDVALFAAAEGIIIP